MNACLGAVSCQHTSPRTQPGSGVSGSSHQQQQQQSQCAFHLATVRLDCDSRQNGVTHRGEKHFEEIVSQLRHQTEKSIKIIANEQMNVTNCWRSLRGQK
jgi:hypothetical protein